MNGADVRGSSLERRAIARVDYQLVAERGQPAGEGEAKAAGGAGHDCHRGTRHG